MRLTELQILKKLQEKDFERQQKNIAEWNKKSSLASYDISILARELFQLNEAIEQTRSVYLHCIKEPRNLDSGSHYFQIIYVNEEGKIEKFWFPPLMDKTRNCSVKWAFSSGTIGMDRGLDSTDHIFNLLEKVTGNYIQPNTL